MTEAPDHPSRGGRQSSVEKIVSRLGTGGGHGDAGADRGTAANGPLSAEALAPVTAGRTSKRVEIDLDRMSAAGFITSLSERSLTAEEFRLIKRPLLLKAFDKGMGAARNSNLVMVTSARPGEGKTFCAVSLAVSIALERDLTVLLVDADVAKPDVPRVLGFEPERGLVDLVADESLDVADVLLRTSIEKLAILPAGHTHPLATELLASERMERIVEDIAKRYPDRMIIFDSPPVLNSSIAGVLALHVGQTVFVVEADRTSQTVVDSALSLVNACKNISLLLNKTRSSGGADKFGTYYGYQ